MLNFPSQDCTAVNKALVLGEWDHHEYEDKST